jgi:hypothetical protein
MYDSGEELPTAPAKTTFLEHNGRTYPAKFILGLAYREATGQQLDHDDFSGGD